jgi:hypothetical protein
MPERTSLDLESYSNLIAQTIFDLENDTKNTTYLDANKLITHIYFYFDDKNDENRKDSKDQKEIFKDIVKFIGKRKQLIPIITELIVLHIEELQAYADAFTLDKVTIETISLFLVLLDHLVKNSEETVSYQVFKEQFNKIMSGISFEPPKEVSLITPPQSFFRKQS